jgi:TRAP-type uncharacterized transport system fused permease subunit
LDRIPSAHRGYASSGNIPGVLQQRLSSTSSFSFGTEGIYGTPTSMCQLAYIFLFILFGAFLERRA